MLNWNTDDTICAIASGTGPAPRGIVRLAGPKAIEIAERLTRSVSASSTQALSGNSTIEFRRRELWLGERLGWIEADSYWWQTSRSYTGQPAVEFHLLGSLPLLESLLAQCCKLGARIAQPGEFTLRAFLAGRMDLSQAEAVLGVINARGEFELHRALHQLAGGLAKPIARIRAELINALAHLEAGLDFVDEDIEFISASELQSLLNVSLKQIQELQAQIESRNVSYGTPKVVLVGRPNAGKSSLFNALMNRPTAIVSAQRGTTRDYVAAPLQLSALEMELVDTAGLDDSLHSEIDVESQVRTKRQMDEAALVIHVIDATADVDNELAFFQASTAAVDWPRKLVVLNKLDAIENLQVELWRQKLAGLVPHENGFPCVMVSTVTGFGLLDLRAAIESRMERLDSDEGLGMLPNTAQRCRDSLQRCADALQGAIDMTQAPAIYEELIAAEIRLAMEELGWIAGEVYTDDLLDRIFSQFCIGK